MSRRDAVHSLADRPSSRPRVRAHRRRRRVRDGLSGGQVNARLKVAASGLALGSLALLWSASVVFANPLTGLKIDSACSSSHLVTIETHDIQTKRFIELQAYVLVSGTWSKSGGIAHVN